MATEVEKGCYAIPMPDDAPQNSERGLDKSWLCLSRGCWFCLFCREGERLLWAVFGTDAESWEILIFLLRQLEAGTACSQRWRNENK